MQEIRIAHLDLGKVNEPYKAELREAACRVIDSGRYVGGEEVAALECEMARLCETPYAVGVANGLDALRLVLMAYVELGVLNLRDEVIVPANTYVASFLAISQAGLVPVPVDPDPLTMNITAEGVSRVLTERTRAVMPVHLYGRVAWNDELRSVIRDAGLIVVEDCAQAVGARSESAGLFGTHAAGSLGHAAGISFYPTKNLGALGDAGMVVTHDGELAKVVRALANYGSTRRYHNEYIGLNSRLDPIQAAILRVKLKYLPQITHKRIELAQLYDEVIVSPLVVKPLMPRVNPLECVWHQYVVRVLNGRRDELRRFMLESGVATDVHYPCAPHCQPCYKELAHGELPVAEMLAREVLSLPVNEALSADEVREVAEIVNSFL